VPYAAPNAVDAIAARYGATVRRVIDFTADGSDAEARALYGGQLWARDACFGAAKLLHYTKNVGRISEVYEDLPHFAVVRREAMPREPKSDVMARLTALAANPSNLREGVAFDRGKGSALVIPHRRGKGFIVQAEAFDSETAEEICGGLIDELFG